MGVHEQVLICEVEIPKGARNKYEYDPELGGIKFDRLLISAATYPTDYGYLRDTRPGWGSIGRSGVST
jgi:inorganic pyrophosphatase